MEAALHSESAIERGGYAFTRGLDYPAIVSTSERVAWTVDEIFRGRRFDPTRSIVPTSWVPTRTLGFLDDRERLVLNHCRAFSYVHLIGNFEEFVPLHLASVVQHDGHDDRAVLRALLRFADEEMKHQQLFARAERVLEESCGHRFARYFDAEKTVVTRLTSAILAHPPLPIFVIAAAFEWGTQRHYLESVRERGAECVDPLYVDILKAHWIEEAQHTKADALEIARLAACGAPDEVDQVFDHVAAIGALIDEALVGQAGKEAETLAQVTGRRFSAAEDTALRETLCGSLRDIISGVGLSHPTFVKIARELSSQGAARLGIA